MWRATNGIVKRNPSQPRRRQKPRIKCPHCRIFRYAHCSDIKARNSSTSSGLVQNIENWYRPSFRLRYLLLRHPSFVKSSCSKKISLAKFLFWKAKFPHGTRASLRRENRGIYFRERKKSRWRGHARYRKGGVEGRMCGRSEADDDEGRNGGGGYLRRFHWDTRRHSSPDFPWRPYFIQNYRRTTFSWFNPTALSTGLTRSKLVAANRNKPSSDRRWKNLGGNILGGEERKRKRFP